MRGTRIAPRSPPGPALSNGAPLTARSFGRAFARVLAPSMRSDGAFELEAVVGADDVREGSLPRGIVVRNNRLVFRLTRAVPDFVANRMGIVNCANEQYGRLEHDPAIDRHYDREWDNAVYVITRRVLERATASGTTTSAAANALADEACQVPHPIWGHRGRALVDEAAAALAR